MCVCVCVFAMTIWRVVRPLRSSRESDAQPDWSGNIVVCHRGSGGSSCSSGLWQNLLVQKGEKKGKRERHRVGQEAEDRIKLPLPFNGFHWRKEVTLVTDGCQCFFLGQNPEHHQTRALFCAKTDQQLVFFLSFLKKREILRQTCLIHIDNGELADGSHPFLPGWHLVDLFSHGP